MAGKREKKEEKKGKTEQEIIFLHVVTDVRGKCGGRRYREVQMRKVE